MDIKKESYIDDNVESNRWIVSYADFVTLLFCLFVVLYAMSSVDQQKYKSVAHSISTALNTQTLKEKEDNINLVNIAEIIRSEKPPINSEFLVLKKNIREGLNGFFSNELISIKEDKDWIEIELKNSILFDEGSARLMHSGFEVLEKIALKLKPIPNIIQVEGFTDDIPVQNQYYPSNWELSSARSAAIVRKLEDFGVQSERMSVVGYGKNYPVADNKLDNGPSQNRRVKLLIFNAFKRTRLESMVVSSKKTQSQDIHPVDIEGGNIRFTNVKDRNSSSFDLK